MANLIRRRPIVAFFVLAYLGSWVLWSPWWLFSNSGLALGGFDLPGSAVPGINQLGLFAGPFAAALLVTGINDGRAGLKRLLARCLRWRVGWLWWVFATVVIALATGVGYLFSETVADWAGLGLPAIIQAVVMGVIFLLGGPLQEEPGWRGVALPRMQQHLHPALTALIIGVLWCAWHAPLFVTREWDTPRANATDLLAYLVMVVALSFILSWLTNASGGSVLLAIIGHNTVNWTLSVLPLLAGREAITVWPAAIGFAVLAGIGLIVTRGRLGFTSAGEAAG